MFTGIVQAAVPVVGIVRKPQLITLTLSLPEPLRGGLAIGASIAVNGTCLTVTGFENDRVGFDVMMESLRLTNLGRLDVGSLVNVERAAHYGAEVGGHVLSGHVHGIAEIVAIERPDADNCVVRFRAPAPLVKYIMDKGYVALNGCSLTICDVQDGEFSVYLIPETLRVTVFGHSQVGDQVNLEVDSQTQAIVDTVERVLAARGY